MQYASWPWVFWFVTLVCAPIAGVSAFLIPKQEPKEVPGGGPKWKSLTPDQQSALTDAFAQHFIATYATRLSEAIGGKFDVNPKSETRGGSRVVRTRVANASGDDSDVDFVVNAQGRIQDVRLNGNVSEIAAQRTSFAEPLKAGGPDALLKFLRERTDKMLAVKPAP